MSKKITDILRSLGWHDAGSRKFKEYGSQKAWEPEIVKEEKSAEPVQESFLNEGFMSMDEFGEEAPF